MSQEQERSAWLPPGPLAWTFPAGLLLLTTTVLCLVIFLLMPRTMPLACEMQFRLCLSFALGGGAGALLIPLAVAGSSAPVRAVVAIVAAAVCGALVWLAVGSVFPQFC